MTAQAVKPIEDTMPAPASQPTRLTVRQYLDMERLSDVRHEFLDGEVIAMAGGSTVHDRLCVNASTLLETAFGDRPCGAFTSNMRVRVDPTQYRYPDVSALCGEPQFTDENPPALLNPSLVIEVLSSATERTDREDKFSEYRQMDSVVDYLLVRQDRVEVTHFARQSPIRWIVSIHKALDADLVLESVGITLPLSDLYRKTPFATLSS